MLIGGLAAGAVLATFPAGPAARTPAQRVTLDTLLAAYLDGDDGVVKRTFTRSRDFQSTRIAHPANLERWLSSWHRGKAVILLELADTSTRVAPQYTPFLLDAGRQYVRVTREGNEPPGVGAAFARNWHRAAIGLLHRAGDPSRTEEYVEALTAGPTASSGSAPLDSRLALAVAVAQEHRCWFRRPALDLADAPIVEFTKAAGLEIDDPHGPPPLEKARLAVEYRDCLRLAIARFGEASAFDDTRAEARLRAGWMLFLAGNFQDALDRLDVGDAGDDRDLAYWSALFRGRALAALDRHPEAVEAYQAALKIFPDAQSGSVALALALFRINQLAEADELARALRARPATGEDPWPKYFEGDSRFVEQWIRQLRSAIR
jgi:hypothetical protein